MTRMTMLLGAASAILAIVLLSRLGVSLGWAVAWTIIGEAAVWTGLALLVRNSRSESAKDQTTEMALVALVALGILALVGLGRWLHYGLDLSVTAAAWSSIGAGVAALVASIVVYLKYFD